MKSLNFLKNIKLVELWFLVKKERVFFLKNKSAMQLF
jgi:hypothetical protein